MGVEYSFYDTETGGMLEDGGHEQRYEQAFQLAIIAADADFNEVETYDLKSRRKPNYVPSAGAHVTTRIPIRETNTYKTSEYDMATSMVDYIKRHPSTCWIAWNMKYDTPIVRQTHFRNLRDPLPTTSNGNTRADAMRIAKAAYCFNPESGLVFPDGHNRNPSLKLGNMSGANGVVLIGAHDGVNDTRALMRLCKVMRDKDPKTWDHMMNLRTAKGVDDFLSENLVFMWTKPDATNYSTSAYCYVAHKGEGLVQSNSPNLKKTSNEIIIANLAVDPEKWIHADDRALLLMLKGRDPDNPESWLAHNDQPFRIIKRNDQPVMWPYMDDPCPMPGDIAHKYTDRQREVSRRRDPRLQDLPLEELERRRQLIQSNKPLAQRLSVLADRMWKIWDNDAKKWVERDTGPKLLEDRIYDGIGLNMPQSEAGRLRMLKNWFHSRPWEEREDIVVKFGELFPKPDEALLKSDPVKHGMQSQWRDYCVTLKRLGMIILYEQELAHECPGAYLRNPHHRYWVESYIYQRLTQPAADSSGTPLRKPKYRTIDDAERLANDDLAKYHSEVETKRNRHELTPDLAEEYARRISTTEDCLDYYAEMRAALREPVRPLPTYAGPGTTTPPVVVHEQYHMPDDHPPRIQHPAPAPTAAFAKPDAPSRATADKAKVNKSKKKKQAKDHAKAQTKAVATTQKKQKQAKQAATPVPVKSAVAKAAEKVVQPTPPKASKAATEKGPVQGTLFTAKGNPTRQAFVSVARRSPSVALNAQGARRPAAPAPETGQKPETKKTVVKPAGKGKKPQP